MMAFDMFSDGSASPLSSLGSVSPDPPDFYPSPSSSQEQFSLLTPAKSTSAPEVTHGDAGPPAKKRRIAEPKPRKTEYLNFEQSPFEGNGVADEDMGSQKPQLEKLLKVLRKRRKVVVIAGAGISVNAGVPDFRSSTGLFNTLRERHNLKASGKQLFDASVYRSDASTSSFHDMVRSLSHLVSIARPTAFHHLLASLAKEGRLLRLYTQNVDGIDTSLPPLTTSVPLDTRGPWPQTIQLHGGLEKMVCQKCSSLSNFEASLFNGPEPPSCPECEQLDSVRTNIAGKRSHGIGKLRPRMVLYNEHNPDDEAIGAVTKADLRCRPDAVIVVGTSLKIPGVRRIVREMCAVTRARRDGVAIWINNDPEPTGKEFENCWDLVIKGDADDVARQVSLPRWDEPDSDDYEDIDPEAWKKIQEEMDEPQVVIETPAKAKPIAPRLVQGVLTPAASPHMKGSHMIKVEVEAKAPSFVDRLKTSGNASKKNAPASKSLKNDKKARRPPSKKATKPSNVPLGASGLKQAFKVKKATPATTTKPESTRKPDPHKPDDTYPPTKSPTPPLPTLSPILAMHSQTSPKLADHPSRDSSTPEATLAFAKGESSLPEGNTSPHGPLPPSLAMIMNN